MGSMQVGAVLADKANYILSETMHIALNVIRQWKEQLQSNMCVEEKLDNKSADQQWSMCQRCTRPMSRQSPPMCQGPAQWHPSIAKHENDSNKDALPS